MNTLFTQFSKEQSGANFSLAGPLLQMASAGELLLLTLNPQSRRRSSTVLEDRRKVTADHTPGRAP